MSSVSIPKRPRSTTLTLLVLWIVFYASFTLVHPALLDDADSVHAEVAREMLLRHDFVTLYADGIRYLEKAPILYWSMAVCMAVAQLLHHTSPQALAVAARIPLALTVLALAFAVEIFARRAFVSARAGLYAALILLSSPGIFLFTRILLPDAMVCLWLTLAMYAFWLMEQRHREQGVGNREQEQERRRVPHSSSRDEWEGHSPRAACYAFAACCALGVLTKGLIGIVFPLAIVALYLLLTRGLRGAIRRIGQLHLLPSATVFLAIAAPWHILIALANPAQGHPGSLAYISGHWQVPLPTDCNVHGWAWFYFVNEQVLRYLNLRVPRDYDTVPLYLFWGLCLIWLMPWSAFVFKAVASAIRSTRGLWDSTAGRRPRVGSLEAMASAVPEEIGSEDAASAAEVSRTDLLLLIWAVLPLLFFSFSTRQEYYVLPSLPALAILLARWLARDSLANGHPNTQGVREIRRANLRCSAVLLTLGTLFAAAAVSFLLHTHAPAPNADLADLLRQNPGDYAMSMGHFLDLDTGALALFRLPLALAAASLFLGPLASFLLRRRAQPHAANLALAAGAFGFLLAAHLGLQTFAPVLTSAQLAEAIAPQVHANDLVIIHQEYEYGSTLGFYLQRPSYRFLGVRLSSPQTAPPTDHDTADVTIRAIAVNPIHILTDPDYNHTPNYGRSSNLWYGSFFPDAPPIFETTDSLAAKWHGTQRIFLWQSLDNQPSSLPAALSPAYVLARSGGKEIVSNQPSYH
jgi:4-amino-4-deoxy-L-arabinose transferase-like glycosyltransferase